MGGSLRSHCHHAEGHTMAVRQRGGGGGGGDGVGRVGFRGERGTQGDLFWPWTRCLCHVTTTGTSEQDFPAGTRWAPGRVRPQNSKPTCQLIQKHPTWHVDLGLPGDAGWRPRGPAGTDTCDMAPVENQSDPVLNRVSDPYPCYSSCRGLHGCVNSSEIGAKRCDCSTCADDLLFAERMLDQLEKTVCLDRDRL